MKDKNSVGGNYIIMKKKMMTSKELRYKLKWVASNEYFRDLTLEALAEILERLEKVEKTVRSMSIRSIKYK